MPDEYVDPIKTRIDPYFKYERITRPNKKCYRLSNVEVIMDNSVYRAGETYTCMEYYWELNYITVILV